MAYIISYRCEASVKGLLINVVLALFICFTDYERVLFKGGCSGGTSIEMGGGAKGIRKKFSRRQKKLKMHAKHTKKEYIFAILCWNHQVWSNFNTFVIIWGKLGRAKNIFWVKYPLSMLPCVATTGRVQERPSLKSLITGSLNVIVVRLRTSKTEFFNWLSR